MFSRRKVAGKWRKLHASELNDLYLSPDILRLIKWRRIRRAGHIARMGNRRGTYRVLVGKSEGKSHLKDPDVDGRIILSWMFRRWDVGHGLGRSGSG